MLMDALRSSRIQRKESLCHCHTVKTSYVSLFTTKESHRCLFKHSTESLQGFYHICRERTQCDFRHLLSCFKKSLVVFKSKRTQSLVTKQILWRKGETRQRNNKNMPLSNTEGGLQQTAVLQSQPWHLFCCSEADESWKFSFIISW